MSEALYVILSFHHYSDGFKKIWDWAWLDDVEDGEQVNSSNNEDGDDASTTNHQLQSDDDESDNTDEPVVPPITHSVVFKCIGATKEKRYQELLALASKKLKDGQTVPVQLKKEPTNCFDSRAIAFMCKADKEWERIGYVVSEALPDVHNAMESVLIGLCSKCTTKIQAGTLESSSL